MKITYHQHVITLALADHREMPEIGGLAHWLPINAAYKRYRTKLDWIDDRTIMDFPSDNPDPLSNRSFGAALRACFPNATPCIRRIDGIQHRGLAGVCGPLSRVSKRTGGW